MAKRESIYVAAGLTRAPGWRGAFRWPGCIPPRNNRDRRCCSRPGRAVVADRSGCKAHAPSDSSPKSAEIVQVNQAHGHVVQRYGDVLPIFEGGERFARALHSGRGPPQNDPDDEKCCRRYCPDSRGDALLRAA